MTQELRFIGDGDTVFYWGRFTGLGWKFIGIPRTRFGVSYYVATGDESEGQYRRLAKLVGG